MLLELELGGLADKLFGFLGVLETWQLNDDAVRAELLDLRLGHAIGIDPSFDDVEDALYGGSLLVGRDLTEISL